MIVIARMFVFKKDDRFVEDSCEMEWDEGFGPGGTRVM